MKIKQKQLDKINQRSYDTTLIYGFRYLGLCIAMILVYGGTLAIIFYAILFGLSPIISKKNIYQTFESLQSLEIQINHQGTLIIEDSNDCSSEKYGACLIYDCSVSQANDILQDCQVRLKLSQSATWEQIVINCNDGRCDLLLNSENFKASYLFIYGEEVNLLAYSLNSNNLFFATDKGSLKIQHLKSDQAFLSSNLGDIAIQTEDSMLFNSFTKDLAVCVTSQQNWKDQNTVANDISDVSALKDDSLGQCMKIYPFSNYNYSEMVKQKKHPVFDNLIDVDSYNSQEVRCQFVTNLILMNSQQTPSTIPQFANIKASTSEGNIFINVLSPQKKIGKQLTNSIYSTKNIQISPNSKKNLKDSLQTISDTNKYNEIVYIDAHQGIEQNYDQINMVLFNPIYLHFPPKWLTLLSINTLASKQQKVEIVLSPGICPYIFKSDHMNENLNAEARSSIVTDQLADYMEEAEINSYAVMSVTKFSAFNTINRQSYPEKEDSADLEFKIYSIAITDIIALIIISGILYYFLNVYYNFLFQVRRDRQQINKQRTIFILFQQQNQVKENEKLEKNVVFEYNDEKGERKQNLNKERNMSQQQPELIKYELKFLNLNKAQNKSLQALITETIGAITLRSISSLGFFCENFFIQLNQDNYREYEKSMVEIDLAEFNRIYQLFCYIFKFQEVSLHSEKSQLIIGSYQYALIEDYIVNTEKMADQLIEENKIKLNEDEDKESEQAQEIFEDENKDLVGKIISITEYYKQLDNKYSKIDFKVKKYHSYNYFTENQSKSRDCEEQYLAEIDKNALSKKSQKIILGRKPLSRFVINEEIVKGLFHLFKYDNFQDQNILFDNQKSTLDQSCTPELAKLMKYKIDRKFLTYIYQSKTYQSPLKTFGDIVKHSSLNLIYVFLPYIYSLLVLFFIYIYLNEENKQDMARQNFSTIEPYGFGNLFDFTFTLPSLLTYLLIYNAIFFNLQIIFTNVLHLTNISKNIFVIQYNNQPINVTPKIVRMMIHLFITLQNSATNLVISLEFVFLIIGFLVIVIGTVLFPQVALPILLFFGVIIGVILSTIYSFQTGFNQGKHILKEKFKQNLFESFKIMKEKLEDEKEVQNENQKDEDSKYKKQQISENEKKSNLKQESKSKTNIMFEMAQEKYQKSMQFDTHNLNGEKENQSINRNVSFTLDFNQEDEYTEIFSFIDSNDNKIITEGMLSIFFQQIGMSLTDIQINRAVAYIKVQQQKTNYFVKGQEYKNLNFKEFKMFIDYIFQNKVDKALDIINISYDVLFFSIASSIFKSVIIAYFVYSIYYSLGSSEATFDFSSNSIVSIGGIIGILFTSKDESKILEDEQLIKSTVEEVESIYHQNNN